MQVINIRGTTASGKSTLMRQLIEKSKTNHKTKLIKGVPGHIIDYGVVIGKYDSGSKFGGCDALPDIESMERGIEAGLCLRSTVFFEGLLVSHSYERWYKWSRDFARRQIKAGAKENGMSWAFLIPNFRLNIKRLEKRNNTDNIRKLKGDKFLLNFIQRYKSIWRIYNKADEAKETIALLDPIAPLTDLLAFWTFVDDEVVMSKPKTGMKRFI